MIRESKLWKYVGGDKRSNGRIGYFSPFAPRQFRIAMRHIPMTAGDRRRYFHRIREQDRREGNSKYLTKRMWRPT